MIENKSGATPELLYLLHGDPAGLAATRSELRAADVAEALNTLPSDAAARVLAVLPFDLAVQVLDEPELEHASAPFTRLAAIQPAACTALMEAMAADQQADLLVDLPDAEQAQLLRMLAPDTRSALQLLLQYPAASAGGIMTTEHVAVPRDWTVHQTIQHVSRVGSSKETVYAIYVLDGSAFRTAPSQSPLGGSLPTGAASVGTGGRLEHVVSLRELLIADRGRRVSDVGERRAPLSVSPLTDRKEVARLISKYNLLALPVVDSGGRMLGIVTVDDVIDAIVAASTEDVQKIGVESFNEPYMKIGFFRMVCKRAGWLMALFIGEMLTATPLGRFEAEIDRAVVLALCIPLIITSGGNSGGQSTSLIIRAMALGEDRLSDWWRVARRDLPAGMVWGTILGSIAVVRIILWQMAGLSDYGIYYGLVAATVGASLVGVVTFASTPGRCARS